MSQRQFSQIIRDLNAACYIVVAGFTGMRISEVSNLDANCPKVISVDGVPTLILCSGLTKTAAIEVEPLQWIAGADSPDNPVRRAVEVLTELWKSERHPELQSLFLNLGSKASALSEARVNHRLNEFAKKSPRGDGLAFENAPVSKDICSVCSAKRKIGSLSLEASL